MKFQCPHERIPKCWRRSNLFGNKKNHFSTAPYSSSLDFWCILVRNGTTSFTSSVSLSDWTGHCSFISFASFGFFDYLWHIDNFQPFRVYWHRMRYCLTFSLVRPSMLGFCPWESLFFWPSRMHNPLFIPCNLSKCIGCTPYLLVSASVLNRYKNNSVDDQGFINDPAHAASIFLYVSDACLVVFGFVLHVIIISPAWPLFL